ncbi:MAG: hypothetical protein RJA70_3194 [Pseudomonadota bacterium]|jgi:hypothetical protein
MVPPRREQLELLAALGSRVERVERTLQSAEEQIQLLQERRTALISAAVTGKIDVRNWTPPESKPEQDVA